MNKKYLYIVEPVHEDGSLNVKMPCVPEGSNLPIDGATEDQLFDYYFHINYMITICSWITLSSWYGSLGYSIRTKTW